MKLLIIALPLILITITIKSNALTSSNLLKLKEQEESYFACISLKAKAPYFKLNCENLLPKKCEKKEQSELNGIKKLTIDETKTKRVNKIQEIKLRNLMRKLAYENEIKNE